jgi:hypothetical protein
MGEAFSLGRTRAVFIEQFEEHYVKFTADFLLLKCFQQVISSKQDKFFQEALQMAHETPENVFNSETLHFPRELYERLIQAVPAMVVQFPLFLNEVLLIRSVSCFEVFLTECLKSVLESLPNLFDNFSAQKRKSEKKARHKERQSKQNTVDEKLKTLKPFKEKVSFFRSQMGMSFVHRKFSVDDLIRMHEKRHLIVHNNGVVDKKYLNNVAKDPRCSIGDRIEVSNEYLERAMTMVVQAAFYVHVELVKKFGTSTH